MSLVYKKMSLSSVVEEFLLRNEGGKFGNFGQNKNCALDGTGKQ